MKFLASIFQLPTSSLQLPALTSILFLLLSSCTMKPQDKINHNNFQELHKHQGTENYEVAEIFSKKTEVVDLFGGDYSNLGIDKLQKKVLVQGFGSEIVGLNMLDIFGVIEKKILVREKVLKDGTMWDSSYYINWILNGDTTKHHYIDPFTNTAIGNPYQYDFKAKQKDLKKWFEKFIELYKKSQYIYIYIWVFTILK